MDAAAQEQRVMMLREFPAPGADQRLGLQDLRELRWQAPQRLPAMPIPARATAGRASLASAIESSTSGRAGW